MSLFNPFILHWADSLFCQPLGDFRAQSSLINAYFHLKVRSFFHSSVKIRHGILNAEVENDSVIFWFQVISSSLSLQNLAV